MFPDPFVDNVGVMMRVGILLFDDVEELDFAGPLEVFGATARFTEQIEIVTVSGKAVWFTAGMDSKCSLTAASVIVRLWICSLCPAARVSVKSRMILKRSHLFGSRVLVLRSSACVLEPLF